MAKPNLLRDVSSVPAPIEDDRSQDANGLGNEFGRAGRIGAWALVAGFGGFLLWAAFAPLDEGVPSQGQVAIDTKRKAVQHQVGGILKEVRVGEGDQVQEGQLLFKLDDAAARASFETVRQRYLGFRAIQGRLLAEQGGQDTIEFHPDLQAAAADPLIRQQMFNQEQLLRSRRAALRADLQSIEENIQGQQALSQAYASMLSSRRTQLSLLDEELTQTRKMVAEGYVPRTRQLEMERQAAESSTFIAELIGNMGRARRSVAELRQRAIARQQEYHKEVETQQAEVSREVLGDFEKFLALRDELGRTEIRSPASGQVVALVAQTVGGVIAPGQKLMDVVPANEPLLLETRVPPHLIDRVHAGMPVDVRFSTFAHSPQLVVQGKLVSVSGDLLTDAQTNTSYFLARVAVTQEGQSKLGKRSLQPGMPVEVVFKTGERSLLVYLLHPLTKRIAASMKEE
ncbi:HlyD family type I secretion periplasmic adaptor subunit [Variovorax sp. Varisp85]|uniref:HlyD family type I secretion periplasmic adaptor subunit n=1 Tax=unclassified Variovorax TaxID=663243 RepID=UPI00027102CB|nr:HlyD family type I secretion periplasmic adaptor subunit [Variovorax sp. CF313]EJL71779.1 type I secretion membrane fusion protein, HlyD family [Variovorax sp. CF313]